MLDLPDYVDPNPCLDCSSDKGFKVWHSLEYHDREPPYTATGPWPNNNKGNSMSIMDNEEAATIFYAELNERIAVLSNTPLEDDEDDPWERVYADITKLIVNATDVFIGLRFAEEHIREQKEKFNDNAK